MAAGVGTIDAPDPVPSWPMAVTSFAPQAYPYPATVMSVWLAPAAKAPMAPVGRVTVWGVEEEDPPVPSSPFALLPQQYSVLAVVAQAETRPADIWVTPEVSPVTAVGEVWFPVAPSPSWSDPPAPQHLAAPETIAQEKVYPTDMEEAPEDSPVGVTGVVAEVVVPLPSWPDPFCPQHTTAPDDVRAHTL